MCIGGFPGGSAGKESPYNAGDPGSIPGSGRSAGEEIAYPLQYSWASLVAQLVKNLPAKQETWVWSLGWEDPLEKWKATCSSILERVAYPFSSISSRHRNRTRVFCIAGRFFTDWAMREALVNVLFMLTFYHSLFLQFFYYFGGNGLKDGFRHNVYYY